MSKNLATPRKFEYLFGWIYMALYLIGMDYILLFIFRQTKIDLTSMEGSFLVNMTFFVVNFIAVLLIFRKYLYRSFAPLKERRFGWVILAAAIGYAINYGGSLILAILYEAFGYLPENLNEETLDIMIKSYPVLMVIATVVFAPITEECLFRGLIFAPICKRCPWLAYVVSSFLFAFLHVMLSIGVLPAKDIILCMLQYIPAGIGLAFAYHKTKSIWASILLHAFINLLSVIATFMLPIMEQFGL